MNVRILLLSIALLSAPGVALGWIEDINTQCSEDEHCPEGYHCINGSCMEFF